MSFEWKIFLLNSSLYQQIIFRKKIHIEKNYVVVLRKGAGLAQKHSFLKVPDLFLLI